MEYNTVFFGDVAKIKNGYAFKSKEFKEEGIPVIKIKNIISPIVDIKDTQKVSIKTYEETKNFLLKKGDILISLTGSGVNQMSSAVGKVGKIEFDYTALQNQRVGKFELKYKNSADLDFLFYYFLQPKITNYLVRNSTGSANQANISSKLIETVKIPNFSLKKQKSISKILNQISRKIEINKKIIANLEELSQTLFKRWFVDFEFPDENGNPYKSSGGELVDSELGKIPRGWEIITINDFANNNVITGKTPSTKIKENYSETGVPFLTIPDMHKDIFALNTERYISELGIEKLSKKVLPKNSLSISCIATPGLVSIIANDTLTNQQINSFTPNENALYYLYFKLKGMKDYIRDLGSGGSATLNLNKTQFSKIKLIKPINEILYNYDKLASPNFKMILNIQKEIQQLTQFRDTLLPKLMSGEIEIPDDIEVNEDELSI
ncbi:TPA: restriction endonuclease subunit S [Staphylococcus aureus]|nr:restriction endonuclease subunit S [Staphylococcus aureus]HCQ3540837.1 restriction endonuclease subunit S [Staphylococcus aureus]HCQ3560209.1 restriction endonuclease subunit S [Staphylococcus aureus]HCQ3563113.1 restriction endonuclease subunit S [Staphylococcus aureus]